MQEEKDLVLLGGGQAEVANRLVDVCINFWKRPVGDPLSRFARWFMHASVQRIARIVEVDKGLQPLEVAIMRVRLYETWIRPHVYVAAGWDLKFAIELGCEYRPGRVWVQPSTYTWPRRLTKRHSEAHVGQETANSKIKIINSRFVRDTPELVRVILVQKRQSKILRRTDVSRSEVGKQRRYICRIRWCDRGGRGDIFGSVQMAGIAMSFTTEQIPTRQLVRG